MGNILVMIRRIGMSAWRYRWAAVALSWIVCGAGWTYVYTIPNQYEASARLYVDADAVLTPLLRGLAIDNVLSGQLDVLQRTLLSRPNLEKLVSNTDLDLSITGPADLEAMVAGLGSSIRINPQTRNLFTITYRNNSPKLAFDVVQTILTTFIESKTGNNRSEMENAQLFLQQQLSVYERQLRDAEKKKAEFRAKYLDILPLGDSGASRLEQQVNNVRLLQGQLADELAKRELLARELAATPPLLVTDTEQIAAAAGVAKDPRVEGALRDLEELRLRYTENHPDVVSARVRLAAMQAAATATATAAANAVVTPPATGSRLDAGRLDLSKVDPTRIDPTKLDPTKLDVTKPDTARGPTTRNVRSVPNPIFESMKVRLVDSESVIAALQRKIAEAVRERDRIDEIARSAPGVQAEFLNINRDYDVLQRNYGELLGRRESMRIATAAEADADKIKIQIIDPPQVPQNPVAPRRSFMMSAVLIAGLAAGAALAVLLVQFDQSFHTIDELRDLGLPVAGGISLLNVTVARGRLAAVLMFGLALVLLGAIYTALIYRLLHTPGIA